jgi:hypothetical protein
MTEHEENPRNGSDSPVMFVGGLVMRFIGAVAFLGGFALIVAGIVNIVGLHDRAGGTTGIVFICGRPAGSTSIQMLGAIRG